MKFIDPNHDRWHEVTADDSTVAVPAAEPWSIVTLAQWQTVRGSWPAEASVGLAVDNDVDIESVAGDLPRFALVSLHFPKWTDGRAYSQARLLRARFRFAGEIRATGEVLIDMLPLLARTYLRGVIHWVLDNYSTHKHREGEEWLRHRPRFHLHLTPARASWMNQGET